MMQAVILAGLTTVAFGLLYQVSFRLVAIAAVIGATGWAVHAGLSGTMPGHAFWAARSRAGDHSVCAGRSVLPEHALVLTQSLFDRAQIWLSGPRAGGRAVGRTGDGERRDAASVATRATRSAGFGPRWILGEIAGLAEGGRDPFRLARNDEDFLGRPR